MDSPTARETRQYPSSPESVAAARHFVADWLSRAGVPEAVLETAVLVTSELAANAVVHGQSALDVTMLIAIDLVRIEVRDAAPGMPTVREPGDYDAGGRGLHIVDALATRWGAQQVDGANDRVGRARHRARPRTRRGQLDMTRRSVLRSVWCSSSPVALSRTIVSDA